MRWVCQARPGAGPTREAQPSLVQSVSGSKLGAAAEEEQSITGMGMCQVGLDHQKWGTLVRMENVGGTWALGNPFRYSKKTNGAAPCR